MTTPVIEVTFAKPLYPKQKAAVFPENGARWAAVEASSKSGKSHSAMQRLIMESLNLGDEGRYFWWISPTFSQAKDMFGRCQRALPQGLIRRMNSTELTMTLINGAVLRFLSGDRPDSAYGSDVYFLVVDEASRQSSELYYAVRSVLTATGGEALFIGNVKGKGNWFYQACRKAEAGEPNWSYARITTWDAVEAGVLPREEIEDAQRNLPEHVFNELYLAEAAETQANPFGFEAIERCVAPLSNEEPVVFGVDVARSRDWTVVCGLDAEGRLAYFERWQADWTSTIRRIIQAVGHKDCYLDSTGVGDSIHEAVSLECSQVERFTFSGQSKQRLMENLAIDIQAGAVSYPEGVISQELNDFEYVYTATGPRYSAPSGVHDDCVMALALACMKRKNTAGPGVWL